MCVYIYTLHYREGLWNEPIAIRQSNNMQRFFQSGSVQGALLWVLRVVPGPRRSGSE